MDDKGSTAITAQGGIALRDETQGATTADGCVEMEESNVEAKEATFVAVHNYLLATEESSERYPTGYNKEQKEDPVEKLKGLFKVTLFSGQRYNFSFAALILHSWFVYFLG